MNIFFMLLAVWFRFKSLMSISLYCSCLVVNSITSFWSSTILWMFSTEESSLLGNWYWSASGSSYLACKFLRISDLSLARIVQFAVLVPSWGVMLWTELRKRSKVAPAKEKLVKDCSNTFSFFKSARWDLENSELSWLFYGEFLACIYYVNFV